MKELLLEILIFFLLIMALVGFVETTRLYDPHDAVAGRERIKNWQPTEYWIVK